MNGSYKAGTSLSQAVFAVVATIALGSVALVGTIGPAGAVPLSPVAAQPHG